MSKIIVHNSYIVLEDYELNACAALENFFKIYDPVTHQKYYKGVYYDKENKKFYMPRYLVYRESYEKSSFSLERFI